jgi:hypothetical protein
VIENKEEKNGFGRKLQFKGKINSRGAKMKLKSVTDA